MKSFFLLIIATILAISVSAQKKNIVGTWNEVDPNLHHNQILNESIVVRTWIFSSNGTKASSGRTKVTYPIGGVNCTFDLVQSRTDEKWTLSGNSLTLTAIPLNNISMDIDYQKYGNYTQAQKQKINAALPAFRRRVINETRQDWQSFVGHKITYVIKFYSPKKMVMEINGQDIVLMRDLAKMTAKQKAEFEKEMAEYEVQIQKEKELREAAEREANEKAKREAEEKARREEEARVKADNQYWAQMGTEKKASAEKAAAEGVKLIDLGLSVRWADRNLGASSVCDKGEKYAWGEITPKTDKTIKYKPIIKPKADAVLDATCDPATIRWGTGWHVPTINQWKELFEKCTMSENDDHTGVIFTGPNGNSITIPFTEYTYWAHYWANSISFKNHAHRASVPRKAPPRTVAGYELKSHDAPEIGFFDVESLFPIRAVME